MEWNIYYGGYAIIYAYQLLILERRYFSTKRLWSGLKYCRRFRENFGGTACRGGSHRGIGTNNDNEPQWYFYVDMLEKFLSINFIIKIIYNYLIEIIGADDKMHRA